MGCLTLDISTYALAQENESVVAAQGVNGVAVEPFINITAVSSDDWLGAESPKRS